MAAATPLTKWRRLIKKQLAFSNLPTSNEMFYRQYVNIIFNIAASYELGDDIFKIERARLLPAIHNYFLKQQALPWEKDIILYSAALLLDATENKKSPAFQGASLLCGECSLPVKINENGTRYVCPHCNAQVKSGPNKIPLGIPVLQELRIERNRLHERLDSIMKGHKAIPVMRDKYYRELAYLLNKPYECTHIGLITTKAEVIKWDLAMDFIINSINKELGEVVHV